MTAPSPDLVRAVRAASNREFVDCGFPSESCDRYCVGLVNQIRAALAELAEPSAKMLAAVPNYRNLAEYCWRAMIREMLGDDT